MTEPFHPWLEELESRDPQRAQRAFATLYQAGFHAHRSASPARWDRLFDVVISYVGDADERLASSALHYVWVVLHSELGPPFDTHTREERKARFRSRIPALLAALNRALDPPDALMRHTDSLTHAEELTELGPDARYLAWARDAATDEATATIVTIAYDAKRRPWDEVRETLFALLDHEHVLVRAYAARTIGERYLERDVLSPPLREIVATITEKELARPGIAGPLFSPFYTSDMASFAREASIDVDEWIMSILAHRAGEEPDTLPCANGIDFFAHEVFGGRTDHIEKLLAIGLEGLAVAAATEIDDHVEGLDEVLVKIGHLPSDYACRCASWHLAYHYRVLHPAGEARGYVRRTTLGDGVDLFVNLPAKGEPPYSAVVYPRDTFSATEAHAMLTRVLPPAVRGALVPHPASTQRVPGVYVLGQRELYAYANRALVSFRGDLEAKRWDRITIIWQGDPSRFRPEDATK